MRVVQGTPDPLITTASLPAAVLGEPYGPVQVEASGGDYPLVWSTPIVYSEDDLGVSQFAAVGVAQGWQGDDTVYTYALPFAFQLYDTVYTDIQVCANGWINLGLDPPLGSKNVNTVEGLAANPRLAALWDDLRTDRGGDIYIDESVPGQVTIRWDAVTFGAEDPCNFSMTLFDDSRVRFDYGSGNTPITATVGVAAGDDTRYMLSMHDAQPDLGNVNSVLIDFSRLPPGLDLSTDGVITGTPTLARTFEPLFRVEDDRQRVDSKVIPLQVTAGVPGDFDGDGDVDLSDFATFALCYAGSEVTTPPSQDCPAQWFAECDLDIDGDVDLSDFATFSLGFTG